MTNHKKTPHYAVSWWLWNGETFERHDLEVEAVEIAKCGKYRFFRVANPVNNAAPNRKWLVAEGGTGYVLAYGPTEKDALNAARGRFRGDWKISPTDVTQYIQAHLLLLKSHVGKRAGFVLPAPGKGIVPVAVNGCEHMMAYQMML